jgi:hypothetical protein
MIIDTPVNVTAHLGALKAAAPIDGIIRYLNPLYAGGEKCIKAAEAKAIADAGLKLGLVCEGYGAPTYHDPLGGISAAAGARDGKWCRDYAASVGAPRNAAIYFAIDFDPSLTQLVNLVRPYFQAIHPFFTDGYYRVGIYGSGNACSNITTQYAMADLSWLSGSKGWGGYIMFKDNAALLQDREDTTIAGVSCDTDIAQVADCGLFTPFAAA